VLKGRDTGKLILWYPRFDGQYRHDTAIINQGKFKFKGDIIEPSFCWLLGSKADGNSTSFFLESGQSRISVEENKFQGFGMLSSFTQRQEDTLKSQLKTVELVCEDEKSEYEKLVNELQTSKDSSHQQLLRWRLNQIANLMTKEYLSKKLSFINERLNSYVSATYLDGILTNNQLDTDSVKKIYNKFSGLIKSSNVGKRIKEELDKREINIKAKNFTSKDISDKEISLSDFKGKHVLLDFWASWCIPCIKEIPSLQELYVKYNNKGFEIITISIDRNKQNWMEATRKHGIQNFHNLLVNQDIEKKYSNTKQPIPSKILINKKGVIVWNSMNQSSISLEEVLKKEFNEN